MKFTTEELWDEVKAGLSLTEKVTASYKQLVAALVGPKFKSSDEVNYAPDNTVYEFISFFLTQVAYYDPRPTVQSRRSGKSRELSGAYRLAVERWQSDVRLRDTLTRLYVDMFLCGGVGLMTLEEDKSYRHRKLPDGLKRKGGPVMRPVFRRIPRKRFFRDAGAATPYDAIIKGHVECLPKKDLIRIAENDPDGNWNLTAIRSLTESRDDEMMGWEGKDVPRRGEITYYKVWCRDDHESDGDPRYNGKVYYLARGTAKKQDEPVEIRAPHRCYCPRWGPYNDYFGIHIVPDHADWLSPLVATAAQSEELHASGRAISIAIQNYKKGTIADSVIADKIKVTPNDFIIPVEGFDKTRVHDYEIGGPSDTQLKGWQILWERWQRVSGLSDAKLGMVSGEGTATENAIADDSTDARLGWIREQARCATELVLASAGFYLFYDERTLYPLGVTSDGAAEVWFSGGDWQEEGVAFEDFEWKIESHSMSHSRESHERRSAAELIQLLGLLAPMIQQNPFFDWDEIVARLGDSYDVPDLERLLGLKQAVAMARMMAGMAALGGGGAGTGGTGTPGASAPRLTNNVGGDSPGRIRLEGKVRGAAAARGMKEGSNGYAAL